MTLTSDPISDLDIHGRLQFLQWIPVGSSRSHTRREISPRGEGKTGGPPPVHSQQTQREPIHGKV